MLEHSIAAWGYAREKFGGDESKIKEFISALYKNVPVLDTGARGATTTFVHRGIGDVLIAWENEAYLALKEAGKDKYEIVRPSLSILAEPPVAVVEQNAKSKGTLPVAEAYVNFLYTPEAQELAARHFYRPTDKNVLQSHAAQFPEMRMLNIEDFGGWLAVQKKHFDDGGVFDQVYGGK